MVAFLQAAEKDLPNGTKPRRKSVEELQGRALSKEGTFNMNILRATLSIKREEGLQQKRGRTGSIAGFDMASRALIAQDKEAEGARTSDGPCLQLPRDKWATGSVYC